MSLPETSIRQLIEVGAHFGHATRRWNPKMAPYIFGKRGGIHIINLDLTLPLIRRALQILHDTVAEGGCILFVGTKRQAQITIKEAAVRSGQFFINFRWMGGTLTNWNTISKSIDQLKILREALAQPNPGLTKRELLNMERKYIKLDRALGGISDMTTMPSLLFVIDSQRESLAITEARRLGIPIMAIVDSNADPDMVDYPIPANDDAMRAIQLYCNLAADTILEGVRSQMARANVDIGSQTAPADDPALQEKQESEKSQEDETVAKPDETAATSAKEANVAPAAETTTPDVAADSEIQESKTV